MGIISASKSIGNVTEIGCDGTLTVTLGLTASPDIQTNPTDIVLVLDRSGSMGGQPLADMKLGVATFIDILSESTGGAPGAIGSGSRIGIVSFFFPTPPCKTPASSQMSRPSRWPPPR